MLLDDEKFSGHKLVVQGNVVWEEIHLCPRSWKDGWSEVGPLFLTSQAMLTEKAAHRINLVTGSEFRCFIAFASIGFQK